ncbi:hypothetical protein [Pseudomonas amygdali]|uniref:Uncharacterized protein n=2 Tax=Pseudomonas amygdali pv. lachrymans TaxID=53707 RepID=A0ABR5KSC1_PSEAV|nr:hypothetical protein [Pseudomonas amygdali]AXH60068.1 hypothetical protein PLA107_033120 [Pseudomonas amygdali pv. lachrymans str. M301315]KPC17472.1 Uncharacterized protein AC499_0674 [Pseudomonas amygdali pv. lachrymans]RMT06327.1 hypothetical protein ALP54_03919 [Pseudomonas amygdali pv. lachrymans]
MQLFLGWARLLKHFDLPDHHATHDEMVAGVAKVIRAYLFGSIPANIGKLSSDQFAGHLRRILGKDPSLIRELQIAGDLTFLEYAPALSNEKHIWGGLFQAGTHQIFDLMEHYDADLAWELMRDDGFQLDLSSEATPYHDAPILKIMDLLNTHEDRSQFCAIVERASRLPPDLSWPLYLHKNANQELQELLLCRQSLYNAFTPRRHHSAEYRYIHSTVYEASLSLGLKGRLPASEDLFARVNRALKDTTQAQYPWLLTGDQEKLLECLMTMDQPSLDQHFGYILADRFPIQGSYVDGATPMKMALSKAGIAAAIDAFDPSLWQKVIDAELSRLQFQERLWLLDIAARRAPEYFIQAFNAESASFQIDITIDLVGMLTAHPCRASEEVASFRLGAGLLQIHRSAFESIDTSMTFEFGHLSTDPVTIKLVTSMLEQMISREDSEYDVSSFPDSNTVFFMVNDLLSQEDVRIAMKMKSMQEAVASVRLPRSVLQKMTPSQRDLVLGADLGL